jgi:hypothetical protein
MGRLGIVLLIGGIVIAVAIGLAVGVLAGNRTAPTPALLPAPDTQHRVHCTTIDRPDDACSENGIAVRPPVVGAACTRLGSVGSWVAAGRTGDDRACRPGRRP